MAKNKYVLNQTPKTQIELDAWMKQLSALTGKFKFDAKNAAYLVRINLLILREKSEDLFWENIEEVWNDYKQTID
jgi:hypothetical protein